MKILLTISGLILLPILLLAQLPQINWQQQYGGSLDDRLTALVVLPDGSGYIAAGYSNSNDFDVPNNQGGDDVWVIKISPTGTLMWTQTFGGSGSDQATALVATPDGGVLVVANTTSNDGSITGFSGETDVWIVKLDQNGAVGWAQTYGGTGEEEAFDITELSNGKYVIAGYTKSTDGLIKENKGAKDSWIFAIDATGAAIWSKTYGGSRSEEAFCLSYDEAQQQMIIGGYTASNDGDVQFHRNNKDGWVLQLDVEGTLMKEQTYGGSGAEVINDIQVTNQQTIVFIGETDSEDGDIAEVIGGVGSDMWVAQLNAHLDLQWTVNVGTPNFDTGYGILPQEEDKLVILGRILDRLGDAFIATLSNTNGQVFNQRIIGGMNDDIPLQLIPISAKEYIVVGHSDSPLEGIGKHGAHEGWVMALESPIVGVGIKESEAEQVSVVYQTITQTVDIEIPVTPTIRHGRWQLYDGLGRLCQQQTLIHGLNQLEVTGLVNGVYVYTIELNQKVVKQGKLMMSSAF